MLQEFICSLSISHLYQLSYYSHFFKRWRCSIYIFFNVGVSLSYMWIKLILSNYPTTASRQIGIQDFSSFLLLASISNSWMFTGFPLPPTRYNNSDFLLLQSYCYLYSWFCFHNKWHFVALGYISCEEQQWCCGGGDEGAEAAKRATGFRLPLGRGSGWCQWPVGKIHHQEGG